VIRSISLLFINPLQLLYEPMCPASSSFTLRLPVTSFSIAYGLPASAPYTLQSVYTSLHQLIQSLLTNSATAFHRQTMSYVSKSTS